MTLVIENIRASGFATNSSSVHSILTNAHQLLDEYVDQDDMFGWDEFILASPQAKARWLGAMVLMGLKDKVGEETALRAVNNFFQPWLDGRELTNDANIDHQSVIYLPKDYNDQNSLSWEFLSDFWTWLRQDGVAVLGGNDNSDTQRGNIDYIHIFSPGGGVCRKDPKYGFWTLFSPCGGRRTRLTFQDELQTVKADKASTPELVDIKITDYCPFGCEMCYQGSTLEGQHASHDFLDTMIRSFVRMGVFEVAIGGGEPTLHPGFLDLLGSFRRSGIVPNFTTRNLAWLKSPKKVRSVLEHAGSWAFSTENPDDVDRLAAALAEAEYNRLPDVQYILGVGNLQQLRAMLAKCKEHKFKLTLLGSKTTHRGKSYVWGQPQGWINEIVECSKTQGIGIDTAIASRYQKELKEAKVPSWCYTIEEGKFSMYVDAVAKKIGPSSYCEETDMVDIVGSGPWNSPTESMIEAFQRF